MNFSKLPLRVVASYIFDYAIIVACIIAFYLADKINPFHQHFSLNNYTLQYPFATTERVSVTLLCILVVAVPAAIIAVYTLAIDGIFSNTKPVRKGSILLGPWTFKQRLWELNCGILGLLLAVGAAFTITGTLKNAIGKPRPDVIDRCQPRAGSRDPSPYGLSSIAICTQTDQHILQDGFRSFPSGHSSVSFAGLYYLSLYLAAKLHVLDSKGEVWKTFIILVPTLGAALIAGSRIMDARHHPFDVISGALLGMLTAWGSYRQYFPAITEPTFKGRAYPIRCWGKPKCETGYSRTPDEVAEPKSTARPADQTDLESGKHFRHRPSQNVGNSRSPSFGSRDHNPEKMHLVSDPYQPRQDVDVVVPDMQSQPYQSPTAEENAQHNQVPALQGQRDSSIRREFSFQR